MSEQKVKLTPEQIEVRKAWGAEQRRAREAGRAEWKRQRKELRNRLASFEDIVYFHFRGTSGWRPWAKGGICVAVRRTSISIVAGVSVCSRLDTYDKLEARRYAFDRLIGETTIVGDPFGRLILQTSGFGGFRYEHAAYALADLVARNAVACLGKKADRDWMEKHILP